MKRDGTRRRLTFRVGDEEITVTAYRDGTSLVFERDGVEHRVQILADQVIPSAEGAAPAPTATRPPRSVASPGGQTRSPGNPTKQPAPKTAGGPGTVVAPMVGMVKDVVVAVGDSVEAGSRVVVIEAMKMDIDVVADTGGTIAEIAVKAGENVTERQVLVRISTGGTA